MKQRKILVVDDEEGFTHLLKLNLEQTGKYEVKIENTGEKGVHIAPFYKPDLILLDVIMPDISGREVALRLKEHPATANTPIIFLTATISREDVVAHHGVLDGYPSLAKPVKLKELTDCIEAVLAEQEE